MKEEARLKFTPKAIHSHCGSFIRLIYFFLNLMFPKRYIFLNSLQTAVSVCEHVVVVVVFLKHDSPNFDFYLPLLNNLSIIICTS